MPRKKPEVTSVRAGKAQNYATPALEKGLDVIELLARQSNGLTKSELARMLNRTVSEIFRMLLCLERRGYIAQVTEERYSLTLKLFKLLQEHPPTERLIADALPVMSPACPQYGAIVPYGRGGSGPGGDCGAGQCADEPRVLREAGLHGGHDGFSHGVCRAGHQDDALRERTLSAWMGVTGRKPPANLKVHLSRIRKAGFEKRASYLVKGVMNISFPIFDERGRSAGALTMPYIQYNQSRMDVRQATDKLRDAAGEITAAIGGKSVGR